MISHSIGEQTAHHDSHIDRDRTSATGLTQPSVVIACGLPDAVPVLRSSAIHVIDVSRPEDVVDQFSRGRVDVLVFGRGVTPSAAVDAITRCVGDDPTSPTVSVVLNAGSDTSLFQNLVDIDRIFYLAPRGLAEPELHAILLAAVSHVTRARSNGEAPRSLPLTRADEVLEFCSRLACQIDAASIAELLADTVRSLIPATDARCMIYDEHQQVLSWGGQHPDNRETQSAASGVTGYVARTGERIRLDRGRDDLRYDPDADSLATNAAEDDRIIAAPVTDMQGRVSAIVVVTRDRFAAPFSDEDVSTLQWLVDCAAPVLAAILLQERIRRHVQQHARSTLLQVFREEAVDSHHAGADSSGEMLGTLPSWLRRSHWAALGFVVAAVLFASFAKLNETTTGPVAIRGRSRVSVASSSGGLVRAVQVSIGDRVSAGDLLVSMHQRPGATSLEYFREQVRAPASGIVSDILVRSGQEVSVGEQVATIADERAGYQVTAVLPGAYAPLIRRGMRLTLRVAGYPDSYEQLDIENVASQVIGPREAARLLGREDAGVPAGGAIHVDALLRESTFGARGHRVPYRDGMAGEAEVTVRSDRIIASVIPGLKQLFNR